MTATPNHGLDVPRGLAGVVVDTTAISDVDGARGRLSYRGYIIESLVERPFTEVATLILTGGFDQNLTRRIDAGVALSDRERRLVMALPETLHPMHLLQGLIPLLDPCPAFEDLGELGEGIAIAARLPEILALHLARRPLERPAAGTFNGRFLDMIGAPAHARAAFDAMQILQLEHSFNASTFAARVIASTLAPMANALSGAVGTLHGVLHGGADQAALETADRVGSAEAATAFVDRCLAEGEKVMGMGHREYRVVDPRAVYAKRFAGELTKGTEHERTFDTLVAIDARFNERMAEKGKALHANIEFYKGLIFRVLGLPPPFFTAMFAMARVFGWTAHVLETRADNRLMRPAARYVGPALD